MKVKKIRKKKRKKGKIGIIERNSLAYRSQAMLAPLCFAHEHDFKAAVEAVASSKIFVWASAQIVRFPLLTKVST